MASTARKLDRRSDRARQVRELIRHELLTGTNVPRVLPSEHELMVRYGCSRNALREALDLLRNDGLIARFPGTGTFVTMTKELYQHDWLGGLAEQLEDGTVRITIDVLEARLMTAPAPVATRLGTEPGSPVVFFERCLVLDGTPLSVWSSYLPERVAGRLLDGDLRRDFYHLIESELGLRIGTAEIAIDAVRADRSTAALLGCEASAPLLHVTRLLYQESGEPLELGFVHIRGERIQFVSSLRRNDEVRARREEGRGR